MMPEGQLHIFPLLKFYS